MQNNKDLIKSALALIKVGKELEKAKEKLRQLVSAGIPYNSAEMKSALDDCLLLKRRWEDLEVKHLQLRGALSPSDKNHP